MLFLGPEKVQEQVDCCIVVHFHNAVEDAHPLFFENNLRTNKLDQRKVAKRNEIEDGEKGHFS